MPIYNLTKEEIVTIRKSLLARVSQCETLRRANTAAYGDAYWRDEINNAEILYSSILGKEIRT